LGSWADAGTALKVSAATMMRVAAELSPTTVANRTMFIFMTPLYRSHD
jgi:hypothetical protein